jgi:uncharacterized membrane protein YjgN (DUF898 family)
MLVVILIFCIFTVIYERREEVKKNEQKHIALKKEDIENSYKISFRGSDKMLFKIWVTNLLFIICTLGIYYPWGRARMKKYIYSSTYLGDCNFEFYGTGKQMFFGLLKFLVVIAFIYLAMIAVFKQIYLIMPEKFVEFENLFGLLILVPYAPVVALFIHGARKYGMAKTTYRGIRFGYRGRKKSLASLMFGNALLTAITFGFYYPWTINNVRKYTYCNTKFGNVKFNFNGEGYSYACRFFGGWILCFCTLFIYYFSFKKNLFNFFYENMSFNKGEQFVKVKSNATDGKFFKLIAGNWLIILLTLGLGYPFAKARSMRFIADNLELIGNLDLDSVIQSEENYSDATGEAETDINDSTDFFDLDIF